MAENHEFKSSTGYGSLSYSTSFSKVYPLVAIALPSDNLWADGTSFCAGGGASDDVIVEILLCPPAPAGEAARSLVNEGLFERVWNAACVAIVPLWRVSPKSASFVQAEAKIFYWKSGVFLSINNRSEKFPALSLWTNEVADQFVTLTIQNRILKNKLTFTSCIWAEDMDGAEFYEEKMKKHYQKKPHFSQLFSPDVRSSFIRKTMHQTLLFGQRSSSTVPLTFLIACKIWGTCESFSWRGPEIQETGADMREW